MCQRNPVFWHTLHSVSFFANITVKEIETRKNGIDNSSISKLEAKELNSTNSPHRSITGNSNLAACNLPSDFHEVKPSIS